MGRQWVDVASVLAGGGVAQMRVGSGWAAGGQRRECVAGTHGPGWRAQAARAGLRDRASSGRGRKGSDCGCPGVSAGGSCLEQTRNGLAGNLEDLIRQAASRSRRRDRVTPLPFEPMVVRMVAGELRGVIGLLRAEGVWARGVARAERLVERASVALVRARRRCAARGAVPGARPAGERRDVIASRLAWQDLSVCDAYRISAPNGGWMLNHNQAPCQPDHRLASRHVGRLRLRAAPHDRAEPGDPGAATTARPCGRR